MKWPKGISGNPAGRPKGARNKRARELEAEARARGMTPLEVMQGTVEHLMQRARGAEDPEKTMLMERASEIAARLAPFVHPRLQAIQHTGAGGGPMAMQMEARNIPDGVAERILATTGIDVRQAPGETRH